MYRQDIDYRLESLQTSKNGLTSEEAAKRLEQYGPNELADEDRESILVTFFKNFKDVMILVLIAAAILSVVLHEYIDAIIIMVIVVLNAIISTIQERKAQNAIDSLKQMATPDSIVFRDGHKRIVSSRELVPGDIVVLETGNIVPADGRIITGTNLQIEESALTGESMPVEKDETFTTDENIPIGDRKNMVFSSTIVTYGRGLFVVTDTGMDTEIGKIAFMILQEDSRVTPLQRRLDKVGKVLAGLVLLIAAGIFALGLWEGNPLPEMLMTAISLAVAAIPEGLPAVVTIVLALGVQRLSKRRAVIRHLPAVETLGSASVICSDKTGTLTQNKMQVKKVFLLGDDQQLLVEGFALNNDAEYDEADEKYLGDPTETALVEFAVSMDMPKDQLEKSYPRVNEIPFDSDRKMMTTVHRSGDEYVQFTKGSTEEILNRSNRILVDGEVRPITTEDRHLIQERNETYAKDALRVLSLAYDRAADTADLMKEEDLIYIGLLGMNDPPRDTSAESIKQANLAGIKTVMITGDHLVTALAIAKEIGIYKDGNKAITGRELEAMDDETLKEQVEDIRVYARVAPEHKVRIVNAWQDRGHIVAMTGDGVNDAPALKNADIGIAMGVVGTDVSRNAADLVLMDDNFSTIVSAVEEGRGIYDNIQRTIRFLLSCNLGEIVLILAGLLTKLGIPLLPVQILWVNLVTDSLPALALGVESLEKNAMIRPPRDPKEGLLTTKGYLLTVIEGIVVGATAFGAYVYGLGFSPEIGRTMAFATIAFAQLIHSINMRSTNTIFSKNLLSNKAFIVAFLVSGLLQVAVITIPQLADIFKVVPLPVDLWIVVAGLSFIPLIFTEIRKIFIKG
ncbi:MAG TPA: calcium-translocating P-type ATPase, PMCA-type [Tissierellia bacterium]|nr:calcium-translocating P-type ATPase, PMCA-type [Tissierellia bacterium]